MRKSEAVSALGSNSLLLPAWIRSALAANDRLKLYLTVLQAAAAHAENPAATPLDLRREASAAGVEGHWVSDLQASCSKVDDTLIIPGLARMTQRLSEDLEVMAKPVLHGQDAEAPMSMRVRRWIDWLAARGDAHNGAEALTSEQLRLLTNGKRHKAGEASTADEDSLHLLVMDLHKQINHLAAGLSNEQIDGAHVWQLGPSDRPFVAAFMRGVNRTAPLKFDHPGLDTAATRDGECLLLQNDIGTNDAHVLVIRVDGRSISLTYTDLHRTRFEFFQALLSPLGAVWSDTQSRVNQALNEGQAFFSGAARFECGGDAALEAALEGIGSRIVFLIDWNRARKRLLPFIDKPAAVAVLREAARLEVGHMAWLKAGGEQLIFSAMQAAGEGAFRIGERLDATLGADDASAFLVEVLGMASKALLAGQPVALVADETRMLLARRLRQRSGEFDLLDEHAAYCHALAQSVSDGLAHEANLDRDDSARKAAIKVASNLATRAKAWERQADHLVMRARDRAERQRRWQPFARLVELSDDIADALEEAAFLMSLIAERGGLGGTPQVHLVLSRLAQTVLAATQEHVKALAIARHVGSASDGLDGDDFLAACWSVLRAERECDDLLRAARREILASIGEPAALMLANDLAIALESASDRLLVAGYALRDVAFDQAGVKP